MYILAGRKDRVWPLPFTAHLLGPLLVLQAYLTADASPCCTSCSSVGTRGLVTRATSLGVWRW